MANFFSLLDQNNLNSKFAKICPFNNYARKNIGYLIAMNNSNVIIETDDDNFSKKKFFDDRKLIHKTRYIENKSWINIYDFFLKKKKKFLWPRGLPLDELDNNLIISKKKYIKKFLYNKTYVIKIRMLIQFIEL